LRSITPSTAFSGREKSFAEREIIVSKTDLRGVITYVNDVFVRVSGYSERQLLGAPHNIIRHPAMPRCVFKLLWDTVQNEQEIFAYVLNRSKDGTGYWVFAHVTPSYDLQHRHVGYHSNRRVPYADALPAVKEVYATLLEEEGKHSGHRAAAEAGHALLLEILASQKTDYAKFVFGLSRHTLLEASTA
jgi:PAS domain S-box-containing protein